MMFTGSLVLCYIVYFSHYIGSEEAAKKGFPLHRVGDLLPCRADGEVVGQNILLFIIHDLSSQNQIDKLPYRTNDPHLLLCL